ncbi:MULTISPECIES: hypothetical protein [Novosphingobium]|uniref:hypothetical protein n=1 Tax=Novosphingobium TaxID=165696 RepID=UPI00111788BB|nr:MULTISPECIES: hypothetical protein [Novosphingobium]
MNRKTCAAGLIPALEDMLVELDQLDVPVAAAHLDTAIALLARSFNIERSPSKLDEAARDDLATA